MNHDTTLVRPFCEVALVPDVVKPFEIGGEISVATIVAEKRERHRRKRLGTHQLALHARSNGSSNIVEHIDRHAQNRSLDLSGVHRPIGVTRDQTAAEVGAARHGQQVDIGRDFVVHERKTLGGKRRTGAGQRAH